MNAKDMIVENSYEEKGEQFPFEVVRSDIALKAIDEAEKDIKALALKAFCKAVCPNGIRCEKASTPHNCKRAARFEIELFKNQ